MKKIVPLLFIGLATSLLPSCGSNSPKNGALTFICNKDGSSLRLIHSQQRKHATDLTWQINNGRATHRTIDNEDPFTIVDIATDLKKGDQIKIVGNNPNGFSSNSLDEDIVFLNEFITGQNDDFILSGNIMSLIDQNNFGNLTKIPENGSFRSLFCSVYGYGIYCNISDASNLKLPATTLSNDCYESMFFNSSLLVKAPQVLPAETLSTTCYANMFSGNSALISAPKINAKTLANGCCNSMFQECTSLVNPPEADFTESAPAPLCFARMFDGCGALTKAIKLSDKPLQELCYYYMFSSCALLEITDAENSSTTKIFTCPDTTGIEQPVEYMFYGTGGGLYTPLPNTTYYYVSD